MKTFALTLVAAAVLTACGGSSNNSANRTEGDLTMKGQVIDGPIAGAKVCLFSDGQQAKNKTGADICSAETDEEGNYTLIIPGDISSGFLHLIAAKGEEIKLASALGSLEEVKKAAKKNEVTPENISGAKVTHFTTADFVLADTDGDGVVSKKEQEDYVPDFSETRKVASIIKAVVDFSDLAADLIGENTANTLELAKAVVKDEALGTSGKKADEWLAAPENMGILAAVNEDAAKIVEDGKFLDYEIVEEVISGTNEGTITGRFKGHDATMYCHTGPDEGEEVEASPVKIALDAARQMSVIKFTDDEGNPGQIVGTYNPQKQTVNMVEYLPKHATLTTDEGLKYYSTSSFSLNGTYDPVTGKISGEFNEKNTNSWSLDNRTVSCTAKGTFIATKK